MRRPSRYLPQSLDRTSPPRRGRLQTPPPPPDSFQHTRDQSVSRSVTQSQVDSSDKFVTYVQRRRQRRQQNAPESGVVFLGWRRRDRYGYSGSVIDLAAAEGEEEERGGK